VQTNYIKEIQSLRGISILLVFLFHLNQDYFPYGYLGVDVFFVISGFVITKIIYKNLLERKFNQLNNIIGLNN
jgi:peptidoglycan/LPS O-acetylase OafA/YrhL